MTHGHPASAKVFPEKQLHKVYLKKPFNRGS